MEFVVAKIEGCVDRLVGFKVNVDSLFFAFFGDDSPAVDDQTIWEALEHCHERQRGVLEPLPLLYSLSLCWVDVMAPRTESRLTRDLILEAVPYSSANIFDTRDI